MVGGDLNDTLCPGGYRVVGVPVDLRFRGVRYPLLGITVALPAAIDTSRLAELAARANVDPEGLRRDVERSPLPHLSSMHVSALLRIQQNVTEAVSREVSQEYATAYNVLVEAVERWENSRTLTRRSLQLQHANERLREMNRLKNEFLANVSHELKTPMTSVIGFTSLLLRGGAGELPQKAEHYLNRALANARSLHAAINDILDLAHLDSRDVCLSPDTFALPDLVDDALEEVAPLLDKKPIEMRTEIGEECAELNTDRERLRQVLVSLLRNAAKFTHRGHITVSAARHDGEVCPWVSLAVSDTGVGLPSEALPHIFEEFRQVDGSSTRAHSGSGLGLALVRRLAGLLGGEVAVQSQLDEGSTFTISIPADLPRYQERQEELRELVQSDEPDPLDRSTPIVLTVGVDPQRALEVRQWCTTQNYRVAACFDMADALEKAREVRPCAILLQVLVPGQDVWELTDELRADPLTTDVPLIVSSDFGGPELAEAVGAADLLPRDLAADALLNALDALRAVRRGLVLAIVKDDAVRGALRRALRQAGYGVRACAAFADACHFAQESLDAIVLDPSANGEQALSALGRIRSGAWAHVPIVAIVPPETPDEERRTLDAHVDEVVALRAPAPDAVVDAVARVRNNSSRETPTTRE
jgi:signal transduction histidine kinase/DNA-binding response OmpR family regulator